MRKFASLFAVGILSLTAHDSIAGWSCECDDIEGWVHVTTGSSCVLDEPICGECSYIMAEGDPPHHVLFGECTPTLPNQGCLCKLSPADQREFDDCGDNPDCTIVVGESCGIPTCDAENVLPPDPTSGSCNYIQAGPPIAYLNDQDNCVPVYTP